MTPYVVTRYYRAPEIILETEYDGNADIWSIGCIFAELINKRILFPGRDPFNQWNKIVETIGSPKKEFVERFKPTVQTYLNNVPYYVSKPWSVLFPDDMFPPDILSEDKKHSLNGIM